MLAVDEPSLLLVFGAVFGLADFAVLAPVNVLTSRYFGEHLLGLMFGVLSLCHQVGSALSLSLPRTLRRRPLEPQTV